MSSEVSLLVPTGAVNQTTHNTYSIISKVTNLGEGLGGVDDSNVGIDVKLLQYGALQQNWKWSDVVMLLHGNTSVIMQSSSQTTKAACTSLLIKQYWFSSGLISHVSTVIEFVRLHGTHSVNRTQIKWTNS